MRPLAMAVKKLAVANKVKAKHIQRMQMNFFLIKCRRKPSANLRQKLKTHSIFPRQNPGTARERPRTERHSSTSRNVKRRCGINDAPSVRNSRSRKISCRSLRFSYRSPRNFYRSTCFSGRCGLSFLCGDCVWSWPKKHRKTGFSWKKLYFCTSKHLSASQPPRRVKPILNDIS